VGDLSMIEKQTVLVLGAGASVDYDYPSGAKLIESIHNSRALPSFCNLLTDHTLYSELEERLPASGAKSIDEFVSWNPHLEIAAKVYITDLLWRHQNVDWLHPLSRQARIPHDDDRRKENWYLYLWHALTDSIGDADDIKGNKLTVITFNYDISLEAFISERIEQAFGVGPLSIGKVLDYVNIIHMRGKLPGPYQIDYQVSEKSGPNDCMITVRL
jgi:hypothetical protein